MPRKELDSVTKERGQKLAALIKKTREAKDLTQSELAQISGVKVDTIRSIEKKKTGKTFTPNVFIIADLAKALKEDLNKWLK